MRDIVSDNTKDTLLRLVGNVRKSLEGLMLSHNENPDGVDGWEIGLALAQLKCVELYIKKIGAGK